MVAARGADARPRTRWTSWMRGCCVTLAMLFAASPLVAATIEVDVTGAHDYTTIQAGLSAAADGDVVLVYPGTYSGDGNRDLTFGDKNIRLRSTGGPDVTIIDGTNTTGYRGFNFYNGGQDSTCVVRGFTIKRFRVTQQDPGPGAGIRCEGLTSATSPRFADLIIKNNTATATWGSGMTCVNLAFPILQNVRFESNVAYAGAGLYCNMAAAPTLYDVEFVNNSANGTTGKGGGMYCGLGSDPQVLGATFDGNTSAQYGGGLYCWQSSPALGAVTFLRNEATAQGGALFCDDGSSPFIQGATYFANDAGTSGGTYCALRSSYPTLLTSIFAFTGLAKDAALSPGAEAKFAARAGRGAPFYCDGTSTPTIQYACVFGNVGGDVLCGSYSDVLYTDPLFCDITTGNLALASTSVCADTNNPWDLQLGAHGQGCVNSPVVPTTWGRVKALYRQPARGIIPSPQP